MHLPPIRQLQYLLALSESLHFGHAAESVNVTQSTLSTGIKELESSLGVTLVERTNRSVAFTEVGNLLVDRCRQIIVKYEELVAEAKEYQDPLSTPFKLGVIPTIAPYVIGDYVARVQAEQPEIKLYIRENTTASLIQELHDGKLDIIIIAFPYDTGSLATKVIYKETLHLAYHPETQLIGGKKVNFDNLPNQSLLLLDDGHCLRDHALSGCHLKNNRKIHTFGANSLQMLVQMVNNNLGLTFIPDMALNAGILDHTSLKTLKLPAKDFYRDIGFAWRKDNYREKELINLSKHLRNQES